MILDFRTAVRSGLALLALGATSACLTPASERVTSPPGETARNVAAISRDAIPYHWKSVVIQGGGYVTGLTFSPVKPGILYARTDIGGAYRFDPVARSWLPLTDFLSRTQQSYLGVESIAADPVDADRVYMAVGMYSQSWASSGAMMRSSDRGDTWQIIATPELKMGGNEDGRENGERLAIDPNHPQTLFFGSRRSGLWKSEDSASTWRRLDAFPVHEDPRGLGIPFVVFDKSSGKLGERTPTVYAGFCRPDIGLYRSPDGGQTWKPVPNQPTGLMPNHAEIDGDGLFYLSYGSGPGPYNVPNGALYRYDPKHETWTDISPIKPNGPDRFGFGAVTLDASHPGTLLASTLDRWGAGGEIFRSTDSGKTWKALMVKAELDSGDTPYVYAHKSKIEAPQWVGDIAIDPFDSKRALLITGAGVWASEDVTAADAGRSTHWSFSNRNLEETAVLGLSSPPSGPLLLSAIGDLCGFRHDQVDASPSRGTFDKPICANSTGIDFAEQKPNLVVRVGSYPWDGSKGPRGAVSSDAGATWSEFAAEPPGSAGSGSVALSADGAVIVWAPREALPAYSVDGGATWHQASGLPAAAKIPDWAPLNLKLASDRVNAKKIYAFDALQGNAYASEDGGVHFQLTARGLPSLHDYELGAASLQSVPDFEGDVWITSGKEPMRSTDSGKSYAALASVDTAYGIGFGHAPPGRRYPAVYLSGIVRAVSGFFRSDDGGATFARINDDAHQYGGANLILGDRRTYGRVYVAPGGRGIVYGDPR